MPVAQLAQAGKQRVSVEICASVLGGLAWAYASCNGEIAVPPPPIDLDGAERVLRDRLGTEYDSTPAKGFFKKIGEAVSALQRLRKPSSRSRMRRRGSRWPRPYSPVDWPHHMTKPWQYALSCSSTGEWSPMVDRARFP